MQSLVWLGLMLLMLDVAHLGLAMPLHSFSRLTRCFSPPVLSGWLLPLPLVVQRWDS